MMLIKEVYLTEMEAIRPKEKPSHRCSALIPLPVPQFSAAFLYCALRMAEKGQEAKLYLEKGSHRGKAWAGVEYSHDARIRRHRFPQRWKHVPIPTSHSRVSSGTYGKALIFPQKNIGHDTLLESSSSKLESEDIKILAEGLWKILYHDF